MTIAALVVLCVVVLGLAVVNYLQHRQFSDLIEIQAQTAQDRETLLLHSALSRNHAEVAKLQTIARQPSGPTPRQADAAESREAMKNEIARRAREMGYDPDTVPSLPEGL